MIVYNKKTLLLLCLFVINPQFFAHENLNKTPYKPIIVKNFKYLPNNIGKKIKTNFFNELYDDVYKFCLEEENYTNDGGEYPKKNCTCVIKELKKDNELNRLYDSFTPLHNNNNDVFINNEQQRKILNKAKSKIDFYKKSC